jgi:hypothetical protein
LRRDFRGVGMDKITGIMALTPQGLGQVCYGRLKVIPELFVTVLRIRPCCAEVNGSFCVGERYLSAIPQARIESIFDAPSLRSRARIASVGSPLCFNFCTRCPRRRLRHCWRRLGVLGLDMVKFLA